MLAFGDTEFGDLDDAQTIEMKRLHATNKALLEKMDRYRLQQMQFHRQY
jgi:hypothetical protein